MIARIILANELNYLHLFDDSRLFTIREHGNHTLIFQMPDLAFADYCTRKLHFTRSDFMI